MADPNSKIQDPTAIPDDDLPSPAELKVQLERVESDVIAKASKNSRRQMRWNRTQRGIELFCFCACLALTIAQQSVLNYYFVHYTSYKFLQDHLTSGNNVSLDKERETAAKTWKIAAKIELQSNYLWLLWIVGDIIVVLIMLYMRLAALQPVKSTIKKLCKIQLNLGYAYIAWFCYSLLLSAKVATAAFVYAEKVTATEKFGVHTYFLFLAVTSMIFLLLVMSHHYNRLTSSKKKYLSYLTTITLDLLDSVQFLDLLYLTDISSQMTFSLKLTILCFTCFNFMLPTLPLLRLRYQGIFPRLRKLPFEFPLHKCYFFVVNVPYLIIRLYLWNSGEGESHTVGIFLIKNFIMILIVLREIWVAYLRSQDQQELQRIGRQIPRQSTT